MVKTSTFVALQALLVAALASASHADYSVQQWQQQQPPQEQQVGNPAPTPAPTEAESEECQFLRQRLEGPCQSMFAQINCEDLREQWTRLCVETPKPAPTPCVVPSIEPKPTERPFECVEGQVVVDLKGKQAVLVEGEVFEFDVTLPEGANTDLPAEVTLTPSKGIALSTTSLTFNGETDKPSYTVMAKLNPADRVRNNHKVTITADWQYPSEPDCKQGSQSVTLRVKTGKAYTAKAVGDPHVKTFDGVRFDLHRPGVFKFVEGRSFQLQGAIRRCGRGRAGCVYGVAVQFGNSIVRLAVENRQLAVVKGSSSLGDLTIERQKRNSNQYRIFIVSDPSSYVDVKMGRWSGTEYLDITCRASPSLVKGGLDGVLGNANGNRRDDKRNNRALIAAYMVRGANLLTCSEAECGALVKPAVASDEIKLDAVSILHQGYDVVAEGSIPLRASALNSRRLLRGEEDVPARRLQQTEDEVRSMCEQVFQTIPYCTKYVKDVEMYKEQLCVQDTMMVADLKNIDESKIAYLQECRRGIDEALALDTTESAAEKVEASVVRADMALADEDVCPGQCGGRGECGVTGCVCNEGFSGMACEVQLGL